MVTSTDSNTAAGKDEVELNSFKSACCLVSLMGICDRVGCFLRVGTSPAPDALCCTGHYMGQVAGA